MVDDDFETVREALYFHERAQRDALQALARIEERMSKDAAVPRWTENWQTASEIAGEPKEGE